MKILIINHEFPPIGGGASNASWFLAKSLTKLNNKVFILTSSFKNLPRYEVKDKLTIYRTPTLRRFAGKSNTFEMFTFVFSSLRYVNKIIQSQKIDRTISFFTIPAGITSLYAYRKSKIPYLTSLRGGDVPKLVPELTLIHKLLTPLRRLILSDAKFVIANSVSLKDLSESEDPTDVKMIPNGVDTTFFKPLKIKKLNEIFRFLFVGRLHPQKNLFFLLDQMKLFKDKNQINFILQIVGDGYLRKDLEIYAQTIGLNKQVIWSGWCAKSNLVKIYQKSDCLINPSLYEGMPNVVLESMACGLPVIASNIGGNNEIITSQKVGYLFKLGDTASFQKVLKSVVQNGQKRKECSKFARNLVSKKFSWDSVAKDYLKLL